MGEEEDQDEIQASLEEANPTQCSQASPWRITSVPSTFGPIYHHILPATLC